MKHYFIKNEDGETYTTNYDFFLNEINIELDDATMDKIHGDLHTLLATPYGFKAIDTNGSFIEFEKENYSKAYIPNDYEDCWTPLEKSIIEFEEEVK